MTKEERFDDIIDQLKSQLAQKVNRKPIFIFTSGSRISLAEAIEESLQLKKVQVLSPDSKLQRDQTLYILDDDDLESLATSQTYLGPCVHLICYSLPSSAQLQKRLDFLKPLSVSLYLIKGKETPKSQLRDLAILLKDADKLPQLIKETVMKDVSC